MTNLIEDLKRRAKATSRETDISHQAALHRTARQAGHSDWGSYQRHLETARNRGLALPDRLVTRRDLSAAQQIEAFLRKAASAFAVDSVDDRGERPMLYAISDYELDKPRSDHDRGMPESWLAVRDELMLVADHIQLVCESMRVCNVHVDRTGSTVLHIRFTSVFWSSRIIEGAITHETEVTGHPVASYMPDVPGCWEAAHRISVAEAQSDNARTKRWGDSGQPFDPLDQGFVPSGLNVNGSGVWGAAYAVRPLDSDMQTVDVEAQRLVKTRCDAAKERSDDQAYVED